MTTQRVSNRTSHYWSCWMDSVLKLPMTYCYTHRPAHLSSIFRKGSPCKTGQSTQRPTACQYAEKETVKCSTQSGSSLSIPTHGDLQRRGGSKIVRAKGGQQHQGNLQVKQGSCTYQLGDCDWVYKTHTRQKQPSNREEEGGMKSHPSPRSYCHLITARSISFH